MTEAHNADLREREYQRRYAMLLATAWRDQEFMQRLREQPRECFKQFGITIPEDQNVHVHVDSDQELHIVIPARPPDFGEAIEIARVDDCWKSSKCWNLCD